MSPSRLFLILLISCVTVSASAQIAAVNGIDRDGYGGVYEISGAAFDGGNYWWMCIEPTSGTSGAGNGQGLIADALSLTDAWDRQNTERLTDYQNNGSFYTALPNQVRIMEYVLDTYLPWSEVGASGRFTEQNSSAANYGTNTTFYNAFFTVQNFLAGVYGTPGKTDFTDIGTTGLNPFTFEPGNAIGDLAALAARQALFETITNDVAAKAGTTFFDTYAVQGSYLVASSSFSLANNTDPNAADYNWQDALIVLAPVPEPSGALLIACTGLVVMLRRFRKLGKAR
jgi:hypothetical protein